MAIPPRYSRLLIVLLLLAAGCSPKNNTFVNRQYHTVTAYFNVLFNGRDSYQQATKEAEKTEPAGFDELLPVFAFVYESVPGQTSSAMQRSIDKGNKTILRHSITAKPKNKKNLTREQRQFYNKKEFNPWIDDAYLLIGQSHVYLHEFAEAQAVFDQILIDYPKEGSVYETRLWQAILLTEEGDLANAENNLKLLEKDKNFPEKLHPVLNATFANLSIKQSDYNEAITRLEKTLEKHHKKPTRIRYNYLLAQLNDKVGNKTKALYHYNKVLRMNPPYYTAFNAELATAFLHDGATNKENVRKMLLKALKAERNEDYKDQIYYALAQLEQSDNNIEQAIEYYHNSINESVSNNRQKALSYLALGEYYFTIPEYVKSYNYYDSAARTIGSEHSRFEEISEKAFSLRRLAQNMKIVNREDSLQRVAGMSVSDREKLIAAKIEESTRTEREEASRQQERQQQISMANSAANMGQTALQTGGKWYFYNSAALNLGYNDFQMRWGRRKLEDNWRRRNKSIDVFEDVENQFADDDAPDAARSEQKQGLTPKDKEYYLVDIPAGDSALRESNRQIELAMFTIGEAFRDDLKRDKEAIDAFEAQISRFPAGEHEPAAYVALYHLYNKAGNVDRTAYYKNLMSTKYADNPQVKATLDPAYITQLQKQEADEEQAYMTALAQYTRGNRTESYRMADNIIRTQPRNRLLPQYYLLRAMSADYNGNKEAYAVALNEIITRFPKSTAAQSASQLLNDMKMEVSDTGGTTSVIDVSQEDIKVNYSTQDSEHYFGLIVNKSENVGKLKFNMVAYNAENYTKENFELVEQEIGNNQALLVSSFKDKASAMRYYNRIKSAKDVYGGLDASSYQIFIISDINLFLLRDAGNFASYNDFFTKNYLK